MNQRTTRRDLIEALLVPGEDLDGILNALRACPDPLNSRLLRFDRRSLRMGISAFERKLLTAEQLERWAEAIHSCDDVGLDPADRDMLADALLQLSTPELFGSMDEIVAGIRLRAGQ